MKNSVYLEITKSFEIACAHRIVGHKGLCANIHGHNYKIELSFKGRQNHLGVIIDFGEVTNKFISYIKEQWDHAYLIWEQDSFVPVIMSLPTKIQLLDFNVTAENMAKFLLRNLNKKIFNEYGGRAPYSVSAVKIFETSTCSAEAVDVVSY